MKLFQTYLRQFATNTQNDVKIFSTQTKNKTAQPYWLSGFQLVAEIGLEFHLTLFATFGKIPQTAV